MQEVQAHLARLVEMPDPEVRDDDRRAAAKPLLLGADTAPPFGTNQLPGEVRKSIF